VRVARLGARQAEDDVRAAALAVGRQHAVDRRADLRDLDRQVAGRELDRPSHPTIMPRG
jgi:hypothetical protein